MTDGKNEGPDDDGDDDGSNDGSKEGNNEGSDDGNDDGGDDDNSWMSNIVTSGLIVYFSKTNDVKEWVVNDLLIS